MSTQVSEEPSTYAEGEKVLCFHLGYLYEAKILKAEASESGHSRYFVHYNGWKKTWDEWVPSDKILKLNDVNREKQKSLRLQGGSGESLTGPSGIFPETKSLRRSKASEQKTDDDDDSVASLTPEASSLAKGKFLTPTAQKENLGTEKRASNASGGHRRGGTVPKSRGDVVKDPLLPVIVGGTSTRPIISAGGHRGRSHKLTVESKDSQVKRQRAELPIDIPETLKRILVEDWDLVSRESHLVVVPADVVMETVLSDYLKDRVGRPDPCVRSEFVASLKEYFNIMLGPQLLYRFERRQYLALEKENGDDFFPSKIYGAVHLLRLFVKLGSVLSYTPLNQEECRMILDVSHDFLLFLLEQHSLYFDVKKVFGPAPADYVKESVKSG